MNDDRTPNTSLSAAPDATIETTPLSPDMPPKRRASAPKGPAGPPDPERRRRSNRRARVFLTIYLAAMLGMFALIVHLLRFKGPKDWLMCLPILGVWLFIFVMASKQLLKTFRKQDAPGDAGHNHAPDMPPAQTDADEADARPLPPADDAEEAIAQRACNLLGVAPGADFADIKRAYRARLRDNDPDQYRDDEAARRRAEAKIRELEGAFRVLERRRGR